MENHFSSQVGDGGCLTLQDRSRVLIYSGRISIVARAGIAATRYDSSRAVAYVSRHLAPAMSLDPTHTANTKCSEEYLSRARNNEDSVAVIDGVRLGWNV